MNLSSTMKWNVVLFLGLAASTLVFAIRSGASGSVSDRGRVGYDQYCQRCHGSDGSGGKGPYDIRTREVWKSEPRDLILVLAFGASGRTVYGQPGIRLGMPPAPYSDEDLAAVAMYAMQNIGKRTVKITAEEVSVVKAEHLARMRDQRAK